MDGPVSLEEAEASIQEYPRPTTAQEQLKVAEKPSPNLFATLPANCT